MQSDDRPSQYVQGFVEFYKLKFKVDARALIPRPETELLVDAVLNYCTLNPNPSTLILDIGTGAGNIAISIAKNLPADNHVKIIATDVSEEALEVAKLNAKYHGVEHKIQFQASNLLEGVTPNGAPHRVPADERERARTSDGAVRRQDPVVVVTNLPYIPHDRIDYLDSSVKDFEPHVALDGGPDGFELYRKLFQQIKAQKLNISLLLGEIDYTHGEIAKNEGEKYFPNHSVEVKTDLAHKQRILTIRDLK